MSTTMATATSTLGNSNLRGSTSRQTRTNPTRTSKIIGTSLRQNSLVSITGASVQGSAPEPHGFYPAITHFADAISALPRDFRRHTSLLKEADAKAWAPEENLHKLLEQCLGDQPGNSAQSTTAAATAFPVPGLEDTGAGSAANSVVGYVVADNASQHSSQSVDPVVMQRRQLYAALRHNLMQIMITMDEKNHVINNANDELLRHVRRLDAIWPHIADEISEEARSGSLKHWAYTETNPVKKVSAPTTRREAAASLAIMHESEIAHRSESRREAMLAKKQRSNNLAVDSDFDEVRTISRKGHGKKRLAEAIPEPLPAIVSTGPGKRKKPDKPGIGGVAMERSFSSALGGRPMSREPSQQESKKRKATASAAANPARKRLNVNVHDSPKLASSPLANTFGKEAGKRSPILASTRPVSSKARHGAIQAGDGSRARPSSAASKHNVGQSVTANNSELNQIAAVTGKTTSEVKDTMKESVNSKGDRLIEEDPMTNGELSHPIRGGLLLERTSSKQGYTRGESNRKDEKFKGTASPRLPSALVINERTGRGRASKHSTPVVESFAEAETSETSNSGNNTGGDVSQSTNGHNTGNSSKPKRPTRPRMKDHHGLHDSLSPRGLPMKRSHKKSAAGLGSISSQSGLRPSKDDSEPVVSPNSNNNLDGQMDHPEEEEDNVADDEERYCYCNGVSYGEMVACDNKDCPLKWFHLECIGLKSAPKSAKWYCEECRDNLARKGKFGSSAGNGNGHSGL